MLRKRKGRKPSRFLLVPESPKTVGSRKFRKVDLGEGKTPHRGAYKNRGRKT